MPALRNPRHERFAQAYVRGETAGNGTQSYVAAFGKADKAAASKLLRRDDVAQRLTELQVATNEVEAKAHERAVEKLALTKEWAIQKLMDNALIALGEKTIRRRFIPKGGDMVIEADVHERDAAAANRALELLGREVGAFTEHRRLTVEHADLTDEQLAQRIRDLAGELGLEISEGPRANEAPAGAEPSPTTH
jgi:hypothetical protein